MGCNSSNSANSSSKKKSCGKSEWPYEAESVKGLPEWIKVGCGDAPYYCPEKNATFGGKDGKCPDE